MRVVDLSAAIRSVEMLPSTRAGGEAESVLGLTQCREEFVFCGDVFKVARVKRVEQRLSTLQYLAKDQSLDIRGRGFEA